MTAPNLSTAIMPQGVPITIAPERREEFSPGLDLELLALIQATAEVELKNADNPAPDRPDSSLVIPVVPAAG